MLDRIERFRAYEAVVAQIRRSIDAGWLRPGDKLPPERELAQMLGTSRATIREACRVLESMKVIESRGGSGRFIVEHHSLPDAPGRIASEALEENTAVDFVQMRRILEVAMAGWAAEKATEEQMQKLKRVLEMHPGQSRTSLAMDLAFHSTIAEASGNTVLQRFMDAELFWVYRVLALTTSFPHGEPRLTPTHREIYEAIASRDPAAARQRMEEHIQSAEEALQKALRLRRTSSGQARSQGGKLASHDRGLEPTRLSRPPLLR